MKSNLKKVFKYFLLSVLAIGFILLISIPLIFKIAFGPTIENVEINQTIGGKLVCKSIYNADMGSWYYDINYEYYGEEGQAIKVGTGEYYGREWYKNEQLLKIGEWYILKTGYNYDRDKLLVGDLSEDNWKEIIISPNTIKEDSLWKAEGILVNGNRSPEESFIKEIRDNEVIVEYLYQSGDKYEEQEVRQIKYIFNDDKGTLKMSEIKLIETK